MVGVGEGGRVILRGRWVRSGHAQQITQHEHNKIQQTNGWIDQKKYLQVADRALRYPGQVEVR